MSARARALRSPAIADDADPAVRIRSTGAARPARHPLPRRVAARRALLAARGPAVHARRRCPLRLRSRRLPARLRDALRGAVAVAAPARPPRRSRRSAAICARTSTSRMSTTTRAAIGWDYNFNFTVRRAIARARNHADLRLARRAVKYALDLPRGLHARRDAGRAGGVAARSRSRRSRCARRRRASPPASTRWSTR